MGNGPSRASLGEDHHDGDEKIHSHDKYLIMATGDDNNSPSDHGSESESESEWTVDAHVIEFVVNQFLDGNNDNDNDTRHNQLGALLLSAAKNKKTNSNQCIAPHGDDLATDLIETVSLPFSSSDEDEYPDEEDEDEDNSSSLEEMNDDGSLVGEGLLLLSPQDEPEQQNDDDNNGDASSQSTMMTDNTGNKKYIEQSSGVSESSSSASSFGLDSSLRVLLAPEESTISVIMDGTTEVENEDICSPVVAKTTKEGEGSCHEEHVVSENDMGPGDDFEPKISSCSDNYPLHVTAEVIVLTGDGEAIRGQSNVAHLAIANAHLTDEHVEQDKQAKADETTLYRDEPREDLCSSIQTTCEGSSGEDSAEECQSADDALRKSCRGEYFTKSTFETEKAAKIPEDNQVKQEVCSTSLGSARHNVGSSHGDASSQDNEPYTSTRNGSIENIAPSVMGGMALKDKMFTIGDQTKRELHSTNTKHHEPEKPVRKAEQFEPEDRACPVEEGDTTEESVSDHVSLPETVGPEDEEALEREEPTTSSLGDYACPQDGSYYGADYHAWIVETGSEELKGSSDATTRLHITGGSYALNDPWVDNDDFIVQKEQNFAAGLSSEEVLFVIETAMNETAHVELGHMQACNESLCSEGVLCFIEEALL
uniref:Uncharacterized protein n=1 Tax=Amphora coffeiformis TaxID=265554 RepID=A0A7S3L2A8_9STRA|mmetsp:Transcript_8149/g.15772  ORF Transcript_8149/g.15772 Transcript_8149/m.15772 type:complete len:651 (+) Transcript_8149:143-2095(+)|eukprot:scaffold936_cov106-Amphora_coffeaeformis.AAC.14